MASDETVILCAAMMGEAIQRDRPKLSEQAKFCAMVRGVALMLNAGAFARFGKLYVRRKAGSPRLSGERSATRHDVPHSNFILCSCGADDE